MAPEPRAERNAPCARLPLSYAGLSTVTRLEVSGIGYKVPRTLTRLAFYGEQNKGGTAEFNPPLGNQGLLYFTGIPITKRIFRQILTEGVKQNGKGKNILYHHTHLLSQ